MRPDLLGTIYETNLDRSKILWNLFMRNQIRLELPQTHLVKSRIYLPSSCGLDQVTLGLL